MGKGHFRSLGVRSRGAQKCQLVEQKIVNEWPVLAVITGLTLNAVYSHVMTPIQSVCGSISRLHSAFTITDTVCHLEKQRILFSGSFILFNDLCFALFMSPLPTLQRDDQGLFIVMYEGQTKFKKPEKCWTFLQLYVRSKCTTVCTHV